MERRFEKMISQIEANHNAAEAKAHATLRPRFPRMTVAHIRDSFAEIKLPSSINPFSLHPSFNRILSALASFGTFSDSEGQIPAELAPLARSIWPKACAWAALFIRDIVLVQPDDNNASAPDDSSFVQTKEKVIWALHSVFWIGTSTSIFSDHLILYESAFKSTPTFVPLVLELCLYLTETDNLAFHIIWEQVSPLSLTNPTAKVQFITACNRLLLPGSRYITTVFNITLNNRLEEPFDPYKARESLSFMHYILTDEIQQRVTSGDLAQHLRWQVLIHKLIRMLSLSTSFLSKERMTTHREVMMTIVDCMVWGTRLLNFLLRNGKGPSWVAKALDEKLLLVVVKLPAMFSSERGQSCVTLGGAYSMLLSTLKPFIIYRPVLRRMLRSLTLVHSSGVLVKDHLGTGNPILTAVWDLEQLMRVIMVVVENFDSHVIETGKIVCSNANCTGLLNGVKLLKRCYRCHVAMYCSRECQKEDWTQKHRTECRTFPILKDGYGYHPSHLDELFIRSGVDTYIQDNYHKHPEAFQMASSHLVALYTFTTDPPKYSTEPIEQVENLIKTLLPPESYSQFLDLKQKSRKNTDILVVVVLPGFSSLFYVHSLSDFD